jgi:two-component system OmpR family response regulator
MPHLSSPPVQEPQGPPLRVLVIEDDPRVAEVLVGGLRAAGFEIDLANDGDVAMRLAMAANADAILLDLMMPSRSGFDILEALQGRRSVPVIVVTARTDLRDRLRAFDLGAMDFVPKPFWIEEIVARIRRLTRPEQVQSDPPRVVRWANATLDPRGRAVTVDDADVALTRYQFDLLSYLVMRPRRAVSRETLATCALAPTAERDDRTIDSHIVRIRKKLGPAAGACLRTVWGIGYRFDPTGGDGA